MKMAVLSRAAIFFRLQISDIRCFGFPAEISVRSLVSPNSSGFLIHPRARALAAMAQACRVAYSGAGNRTIFARLEV